MTTTVSRTVAPGIVWFETRHRGVHRPPAAAPATGYLCSISFGRTGRKRCFVRSDRPRPALLQRLVAWRAALMALPPAERRARCATLTPPTA